MVRATTKYHPNGPRTRLMKVYRQPHISTKTMNAPRPEHAQRRPQHHGQQEQRPQAELEGGLGGGTVGWGSGSFMSCMLPPDREPSPVGAFGGAKPSRRTANGRPRPTPQPPTSSVLACHLFYHFGRPPRAMHGALPVLAAPVGSSGLQLRPATLSFAPQAPYLWIVMVVYGIFMVIGTRFAARQVAFTCGLAAAMGRRLRRAATWRTPTVETFGSDYAPT